LIGRNANLLTPFVVCLIYPQAFIVDRRGAQHPIVELLENYGVQKVVERPHKRGLNDEGWFVLEQAIGTHGNQILVWS
jgi:hypothetical protein